MNKSWFILHRVDWKLITQIPFSRCMPTSPVGLKIISDAACNYGSNNILVVEEIPLTYTLFAEPRKETNVL